MSYKVHKDFASKEVLHTALIQRVEQILLDAIGARGEAMIALSGGSTPKRLFEKICHLDLPWNKVLITLVDERWVAPDHSDSNEYLVRNSLMQSKASDAKFIGMKNKYTTAYEGEQACNQHFSMLEGDFDLVLLGMGEDGHTASFFPEARTLSKALTTSDACVAITPPVAPYERMTMSLSRLIRTQNLFLHIEGQKKWQVFEQACEAGPVEAMPIRAFIQRDDAPVLEVYYGE